MLPEWYDPDGCDGCTESVRMATSFKIAFEALEQIVDHYKTSFPSVPEYVLISTAQKIAKDALTKIGGGS